MSTADHTDPATPTQTTDDQRREDARRYVQQLRAFYVHATVFAVGMVVIFLVNLAVNLAADLTGEWWAWWSGWAFIGWGIGVAIHGLVLRLSRPRGSASTWEEKQISKLLGEDDTEPL